MRVSLKTKVLSVLCVMWMVLIYCLSAQDPRKSTDLSDYFTRIIVDFLEPGLHAQPDAETSVTGGESSGNVGIENPKNNEVQKNSKDYEPIPKNEWFGIETWKFRSIIRKTAHFMLFLCLGILVSMTLFSHLRYKLYYISLIALGICTLYAVLDEFHQYFVDGRSAQLADVRIDSTGALIGIIIVTLINIIRVKHRRKTSS